MKGNPAVPGGPLTSKPAGSNTLGCSSLPAFFSPPVNCGQKPMLTPTARLGPPEGCAGAHAPLACHASLLVVDDNEMNRDMLSRRLQRQGYDVAVADDGKRALELIRD